MDSSMIHQSSSSSTLLLHPPEESVPGDLFGALIRRQFNTASDLYSSMDMCLTIPLLEAPRDIFVSENQRSENNAYIVDTPRTVTEPFPSEYYRNNHVNHDAWSILSPSKEEGIGASVEADVSKIADEEDDGCSLLPTSNQLQRRQYLSMASKEDFFSALHNRQYINGTRPGLLWPESNCSILCLRAMAGIDSAIFDIKRGRPSAVFIAGYSVKSVENYLNYFYEIYAVRKILEKARKFLCKPPEATVATHDGQSRAASLALGAALEDVLHICDAAITELENNLVSLSGTRLTCSLVTIVSATLSPHAVLKHLFYMIAPAGVNVDCYPPAHHPHEDTGPNKRTLLSKQIHFYLHVYRWEDCTSGKEESDYPVGWSLLSALVVKLEATRVFSSSSVTQKRAVSVCAQHQAVALSGGRTLLTALGDAPARLTRSRRSESTSGSSDPPLDYIRVCISSFLVRRVSLPLMEQLDRTLFRLHDDPCSSHTSPAESDDESQSRRAALLSDVNLLPPCAQSDVSSPPLDNMQHALHWASTRIAQAKLQGFSFAALLQHYASADTVQAVDSRVESMSPLVEGEEDREHHGQPPSGFGLVFPLHPLDTASNAKKSEISVQKIMEIATEVKNHVYLSYYYSNYLSFDHIGEHDTGFLARQEAIPATY
jgi:hypothetical protein